MGSSKINKNFLIKFSLYFTSSTGSNGPGFGGGITSGMDVTISGFMNVWFSGSWYLAVFATPYEIATTGLLSVLKASPIISSSNFIIWL